MTWDDAIVMADNMAVWSHATVIYDGESQAVQLWLPDGGGGYVLDETFLNVDIYEAHGNSRIIFRSTGAMTAESDSETFDRLKVLPQKGCNCIR